MEYKHSNPEKKDLLLILKIGTTAALGIGCSTIIASFRLIKNVYEMRAEPSFYPV
jgi:hypothetical protein